MIVSSLPSTIFIEKPTITGVSSYTFNKQAQGYDITWPNDTKIQKQVAKYVTVSAVKEVKNGDPVAADVKNTNAGTYEVTVALKKPSMTRWKNGDNKPITQKYTIEKYKVNLPSASGSYTYNGKLKTPTLTYQKDWVDVGENTSATNAHDNYRVSFDLKDKDNTVWNQNNGGTQTKYGYWTINKAYGSFSVSSKNFTSGTHTVYFSNMEFDGSVQVTSSNPFTCRITSSGLWGFSCDVGDGQGVVYISPGSSATITIKCSGGTNYTTPSTKTITITYVESGGDSGGSSGGGSSGGSVTFTSSDYANRMSVSDYSTSTSVNLYITPNTDIRVNAIGSLEGWAGGKKTVIIKEASARADLSTGTIYDGGTIYLGNITLSAGTEYRIYTK